MGKITLDVAAMENQPPTSSGWVRIDLTEGATRIITLDNLTTDTTPPYSDPEGDALLKIMITALPLNGVLKKNLVELQTSDEVTVTEINNNELSYTASATDSKGYSDGYTGYLVSDVGSSKYSNTQNNIVFVVESNINHAPSVVGDGELDITLGDVVVFTRSMLTDQLNPPYQDPEGNPASNLKIISLPYAGELNNDESIVVEGSVISFDDIDLGLFTYSNHSKEKDGILEGFEFQISDTGSGEYRG
tara:strand:- start:828 stop:1568 length:741 start_codon:yes stop_codon:yes gene_type:complete